MPLRGKSLHRETLKTGTPALWLQQSRQALKDGGFTKIRADPARGVVAAKFHKGTVWGEITVELRPEGDSTRLRMTAESGKDNIWTLLKGDPNERIIDRFLSSLPPAPAPAPTAARPVALSAEIDQLVRLRDSGALSDDEFRRAKARLLE